MEPGANKTDGKKMKDFEAKWKNAMKQCRENDLEHKKVAYLFVNKYICFILTAVMSHTEYEGE